MTNPSRKAAPAAPTNEDAPAEKLSSPGTGLTIEDIDAEIQKLTNEAAQLKEAVEAHQNQVKTWLDNLKAYDGALEITNRLRSRISDRIVISDEPEPAPAEPEEPTLQ